MTAALINRKQVEHLTSLKRATIYSRIKQGLFPAQIKCGSRCVRWREDEVLAWIADPVGWRLSDVTRQESGQ